MYIILLFSILIQFYNTEYLDTFLQYTCITYTNTFTLQTTIDYSRVIKFLRIFEFRNWHLMRGRLMMSDSISEEKSKFDRKMEDLQAGTF